MFSFFTTDFSYSFRVFLFLIAFFMSSDLLLSISYFIFMLLFVSVTDFRKSLLLLSHLLNLHFVIVLTAVPWVLPTWDRFFYSQTVFTFDFFPTFGTTCFYEGISRRRHFFLEGARASYWSFKHRPNPPVCLNHTVFKKMYQLVGSTYVLRVIGKLYQPLPGFEPIL